MSQFSLMHKEALGATFRRVAAGQLELADSLCATSAEDPDRATHEIRKCTKRLRSLIRLFRDTFEAGLYEREMQRYRDISARLAHHRLERVNLDILGQVVAEKHPGTDPAGVLRLVQVLQEEHGRFTREMLLQGIYEEVRRQFASPVNLSMVPGLSVFKSLSGQIAESQRACRKNLAALKEHDTGEAMHELRKTVKTLWYQLTLMRTLWPPVLGATVHQLDILAEKLGKDHDLHELILFLTRYDNDLPGNVPDGLVFHLEKKRRALKKAILIYSERLFAEKPSHLAMRLEGYYKVIIKSGL